VSVPRPSLATELHAFRSRWPSLRPVRRVAELGWLGRSVHHDILAQITNQPGFAVSLGSGIGSAIAVVCSWQRNRSILWAILAGILSWIYVIYFALTRKPDERK
jgi:hypothetical protein